MSPASAKISSRRSSYLDRQVLLSFYHVNLNIRQFSIRAIELDHSTQGVLQRRMLRTKANNAMLQISYLDQLEHDVVQVRWYVDQRDRF